MWNEPPVKEADMGKMKVLQRVIGMVSTNVYLAVNTENQEAFLVDPADRAELIASWIEKEGVTLKGILLTHGHFDHIGAVSELKRKYQVPVYVMEAEQVILGDPQLNLSGSWGSAFTVKADCLLKNEENFTLAGVTIRAYHTPGHTKGGACYYLPEENLMFSGDTIFCESIGRTDFPTGNSGELIRSVRRMLELLPEDTVIYPGHEESTSAAHEKIYNPYI